MACWYQVGRKIHANATSTDNHHLIISPNCSGQVRQAALDGVEMKKLTDALGADLHVKRFLLGNRRFALWQKIDGGEGSTQAATHPDDRRTRDRDRRCGTDHRPEVEQFLQGEGRSRIDRRRVTKHRYRPFKK